MTGHEHLALRTNRFLQHGNSSHLCNGQHPRAACDLPLLLAGSRLTLQKPDQFPWPNDPGAFATPACCYQQKLHRKLSRDNEWHPEDSVLPGVMPGAYFLDAEWSDDEENTVRDTVGSSGHRRTHLRVRVVGELLHQDIALGR